MKVLLNQTVLYNRQNQFSPIVSKELSQAETKSVSKMTLPSYQNINGSHFPNISFKMNVQEEFLLKQVKRGVRCAYTDRLLLCPFEAKGAYQNLLKRPNAQSAINLLTKFERYMHPIENNVFDLFQDTPLKGKKDFQVILLDYLPESRERLKEKQLEVLSRTDNIIPNLSNATQEEVRRVLEDSQRSSEQGNIIRLHTLEKLKEIKPSSKEEEEKQILDRIYGIWYRLPRCSTNFDAFVVKNSQNPHYNIAKRLISTAVGTVEHVIPTSRGGEDSLSNYLLVSAGINNARQSDLLMDLIILNPEIDIRKNLHKHIEYLVSEVNDKKSPFSKEPWYPIAIAKSISDETDGKINIIPQEIRIPRTKVYEKEHFTNKLSKKYKIIT